MEQFPQRRLAIVAKLVSFVAGAVALALALFTLMDDEVLLRFHLTEGGSVLWWIGVTGVVYSCARGFVPVSSVCVSLL